MKVCINAYMFEANVNAIVDLGLTPYITVYTKNKERNLVVPDAYVEDDYITLNVSALSLTEYKLDKEQGILSFTASFNKVPIHCIIPVENIQLVRAKETSIAIGQQTELIFIGEDAKIAETSPDINNSEGVGNKTKNKKNFLHIVK